MKSYLIIFFLISKHVIFFKFKLWIYRNYLYFAKTIKKKKKFQALCEGLLSFMTVNDVKVTINCFQTFHGLFESRPPETVLSSQLNAQIISALYDYQPAPGDTFPTLAWLAVMQEAHCNLFM